MTARLCLVSRLERLPLSSFSPLGQYRLLSRVLAIVALLDPPPTPGCRPGYRHALAKTWHPDPVNAFTRAGPKELHGAPSSGQDTCLENQQGQNHSSGDPSPAAWGQEVGDTARGSAWGGLCSIATGPQRTPLTSRPINSMKYPCLLGVSQRPLRTHSRCVFQQCGWNTLALSSTLLRLKCCILIL